MRYYSVLHCGGPPWLLCAESIRCVRRPCLLHAQRTLDLLVDALVATFFAFNFKGHAEPLLQDLDCTQPGTCAVGGCPPARRHAPGGLAGVDDDDADDLHTDQGLSFTGGGTPHIRRLILGPARMRPRPLGLGTCALPDLPTLQDLAQWLDLPLERFLWLSPETPLGADHYRYKLQPKRSGGLRLLEIPKVDLKRVQRAIHAGLLQHVPVHEAAHGFVAERSVATHAAAHAGQAVVIKFDLKDFFGSIRAAQVAAVWRTLGYPTGVARALATLCNHRTARMVVERMRDDGGRDWLGAKRMRTAHLPQAAPTSPALANLCAFGLDLRLDGLAWVFGATYTRYADDLVFSGPMALRPQFRALQAWVAAIAQDEGFALHPDKTRCLPQHLQQRITWVKQFNPARGEKLMGLFAQIAW